jgi:hypothetical protein
MDVAALDGPLASALMAKRVIRGMEQNPHHPYTLEVQPGASAGTFQWIIRRSGKLIQRSDRVQRTEAGARADGEKAIERLFSDAQGERG